MFRPWLIRASLRLFCLLFLGTWAGSFWTLRGIQHTQFLYTEPFLGDGTIPQDIFRRFSCDFYLGTLRFFSTRMNQDTGDAAEWSGFELYSYPVSAVALDYRLTPLRRAGLTFTWRFTPEYARVEIPLWFPTLLFIFFLWFLRKKRRAKKPSAFPIHPDTSHF